nr:MAG TPA: hypothetical protein [Caudoviricetes sp.]
MKKKKKNKKIAYLIVGYFNFSFKLILRFTIFIISIFLIF